MNTLPIVHHPDAAFFGACPFGEQNKTLPGGRVRKQVGDRFCLDPDRLFCPGAAPDRLFSPAEEVHTHWSPKADSPDTCENCGLPATAHSKKRFVVLADCRACKWHGSVETPPPRPPKVGDVLAGLLAERYSASVTTGCDCAGRIAQMNEWGPDGCEREIETVCGWLIEAAAAMDKAAKENPELDVDPKGRRLRAIAPDAAKRWILRDVVREAIRTVRDWTPPATELTTTEAA